ncbi:MAG: helix-turn-helix domain-containing protein [Rhizomicrobium sp.]
MARAALAASRAIQIIDFLAAQGTTRFTLSELARALDINVASCHGILQELTKSDHLSRHPVHKTYSLGPVLVAIGDVANENHGVIARAKSAAAALSHRLGVEVLLSMRAGDEVLGLAHFNQAVVDRAWLRPGVRLPLRPPLGVTFVAWEPEADIEKWLGRGLDGKIDPATASSLRELLVSVRQRGFQLALKADTQELANLSDALDVRRYVEHLDRWLTRFRPDNLLHFDPMQVNDGEWYEVDFISAPVFDSPGKPTYSMTLYHFDDKLIGADIKNCISNLISTCRSVGRSASTGS